MLSQTLFEIISSSKTPDDSPDHYDVYNGDVNMINTAVDVLDTLATEIESELLMKHIVSVSFKSTSGFISWNRLTDWNIFTDAYTGCRCNER